MIGGSGFIGRQLVKRLVERGHDVAMVHRGRTSPPRDQRVTEFIGDRASLLEMRNRFREWAPDVAIDCILSSAAQARVTLDSVRGIARRVVAVSSGDVYRAMAVVHRLEAEPLEPTPLTEDSALRTQSQTYSDAALEVARAAFPWLDHEYDKVKVEQTITSDPDFTATVLRLPMVYGPGDPLHRLFPVLKRIDDERPFILLEESFAQFVACRGYVENVADAIALAATSEAAEGRTYNVAEPEAFTETEWSEKIGAVAAWSGKVLQIPRALAPEHLVQPYNTQQHLFMDTTRIRKELDYVEPISIDEALRRTIDWERQNPPAQVDPKQFNYAAEDDALKALSQRARV